ncbi:MAG: amidohydrolase family protein [Butyricicoccaceae bacterium]
MPRPALLCKAGIDRPPLRSTIRKFRCGCCRWRLMLAVRAGMDKTDALRAVTSVPAKIAGMQDRIGSLQTGLDADCVLWSGDPLDIATQVKAVFVNGTPEYRRTR